MKRIQREVRRLLVSWLMLLIQRLTPEQDTEVHLALGAAALAMLRADD